MKQNPRYKVTLIFTKEGLEQRVFESISYYSTDNGWLRIGLTAPRGDESIFHLFPANSLREVVIEPIKSESDSHIWK